MRIHVFFACITLLLGCSGERVAIKAFRYGEYENVINYYKAALKKDSTKDAGKANYYIAESYRLSNRIKEAEPYYQNAKSFTQQADWAAFYYAQALKANEKYDEASEELANLQTSLTDGDEKLRTITQHELTALDRLKELEEQTSYYEIKNMRALNTPMSEYAPAYFNDELYFTTNRQGGKAHSATNTPFTKLYKVQSKGANVEINTLEPLPHKINSENAHEGSMALSPNGRIMVFAKGNTGKRGGSPDVDLYISRLRRGRWTDPQRINGNLPDAWESTPAFSPNGRDIYFSSNRKGGYGGVDLYVARISSRGRFSRIRNLGANVNTAGNEIFPFVSKEGILFFSSDGHYGYGMLDLFEVYRKEGKYQIKNMGKPMNSASDDFGIFLYKPDRGFFTSNRPGGEGDDDIYTFINRDPDLKIVDYFLNGITLGSREDEDPVVLGRSQVTLFDAQNTILEELVTGSDGKFTFQLYPDEDYVLIAKADGYLVKRQAYSTQGKGVRKDNLKELVTKIMFNTELVLDPLKKNKIFVLRNIYFDFNKYDIRPDAARELNKLVYLLRDNPEIKIEMGSHTDSVDTNYYNIKLSQQRAESTVEYLISKGIDPERLTAKGYGEERPVAPNTKPDGSDNPVGRQKNRRTEFKILEVGTVPKSEEIEDFEESKYFDN